MLALSQRCSRPVSRCASAPSGNVETAVAPATQPKAANTLQSLDALLGEQAKPKVVAPPPTPVSKPAAASTPSGPGVFSWPDNANKPSTPSTPAARKAAPATFASVMSFEGLAPEVINGRAAMLGFMIAISREVGTGESVFAQVLGGGGAQMIVLIAAVTLASFAPAIRQVPMKEIFNQEPKKVKALGPFAPDAELANGRAAMIGLAAIILLEGASGTAFFL